MHPHFDALAVGGIAVISRKTPVGHVLTVGRVIRKTRKRLLLRYLKTHRRVNGWNTHDPQWVDRWFSSAQVVETRDDDILQLVSQENAHPLNPWADERVRGQCGNQGA